MIPSRLTLTAALVALIPSSGCGGRQEPATRDKEFDVATSWVKVRIIVDGPGKVISTGTATFVTDETTHECERDCTLTVRRGNKIALRAVSDELFIGWSSLCGNSRTCELSPPNAEKLVARFIRDPHTTDWATQFHSDWCVLPMRVVAIPGAAIVALNFAGKLEWDSGRIESAGYYDALVVKVDDSGRIVWTAPFASKGNESVGAMAVLGQDILLALNVSNVVSANSSAIPLSTEGAYLVQLSASTGMVAWRRSLSSRATAVASLPGGGWVTVRNTPQSDHSSVELESYSVTGMLSWSRTLASSDRISVRGLAGTSTDVVVLGAVLGDPLFQSGRLRDGAFLLALKPGSGALDKRDVQWFEQPGLIFDDVAPVRSGVVVAGRARQPTRLGKNALSEGRFVLGFKQSRGGLTADFVRQFGGHGTSLPVSVASFLDSRGFFVYGMTRDSLDFDVRRVRVSSLSWFVADILADNRVLWALARESRVGRGVVVASRGDESVILASNLSGAMNLGGLSISPRAGGCRDAFVAQMSPH